MRAGGESQSSSRPPPPVRPADWAGIEDQADPGPRMATITGAGQYVGRGGDRQWPRRWPGRYVPTAQGHRPTPAADQQAATPGGQHRQDEPHIGGQLRAARPTRPITLAARARGTAGSFATRSRDTRSAIAAHRRGTQHARRGAGDQPRRPAGARAAHHRAGPGARSGARPQDEQDRNPRRSRKLVPDTATRCVNPATRKCSARTGSSRVVCRRRSGPANRPATSSGKPEHAARSDVRIAPAARLPPGAAARSASGFDSVVNVAVNRSPGSGGSSFGVDAQPLSGQHIGPEVARAPGFSTDPVAGTRTPVDHDTRSPGRSTAERGAPAGHPRLASRCGSPVRVTSAVTAGALTAASAASCDPRVRVSRAANGASTDHDAKEKAGEREDGADRPSAAVDHQPRRPPMARALDPPARACAARPAREEARRPAGGQGRNPRRPPTARRGRPAFRIVGACRFARASTLGTGDRVAGAGAATCGRTAVPVDGRLPAYSLTRRFASRAAAPGGGGLKLAGPSTACPCQRFESRGCRRDVDFPAVRARPSRRTRRSPPSWRRGRCRAADAIGRRDDRAWPDSRLVQPSACRDDIDGAVHRSRARASSSGSGGGAGTK